MTLPLTVAELVVDVVGLPIQQGSKTTVVKNGRHVLIEDKANELRRWRKTIVTATHARMAITGIRQPLDGMLRLDVDFFMPRPKTVTRDRPNVPPDGDKLLRAVADALKIAGAIVDDSRIVSWHAEQWYAVATPGARITVRVL